MTSALLRRDPAHALPDQPVPEEGETIVRFVDVQKTYDGIHPIIRQLNLAIRRGEFLTLLGPSGSGKTTTLMMLAGFETPTLGEIYFENRPISALPAHRRGIGMVFQNYALFPHLTVAQNLAFPLEVRKVERGEINRRVAKALRMVELDSFGERRPAQLSGGQQQRIAVARALVFEPQLVLMDEPLGALDKQLREQMQHELKGLHERLGVTIVYVTHDQSEALTMSDRIAVFRDGAIEQLAAPRELYERPRTAYVAQFIGENNQIEGRVERMTAKDQCVVRLDNGQAVTAATTSALERGARCLISIRPDRVQVNAKAGFRNRFDCGVENLTYLGDHVRLTFSFFGEKLIAKVPANRDSPHIGAHMPIGWNWQDCLALPHG
jgi:putative spermidine/putrescine transport system ATP-binding protein